jgi:hypothetical protein
MGSKNSTSHFGLIPDFLKVNIFNKLTITDFVKLFTFKLLKFFRWIMRLFKKIKKFIALLFILEMLNVNAAMVNHDNDDDRPNEHLCPITHEVMTNPVIALDGHTYERSAIEEYFRRGGNTSPMTRQIFTSQLLTPNIALRNIIQNWQPGSNQLRQQLITTQEIMQQLHQTNIRLNSSNDRLEDKVARLRVDRLALNASYINEAAEALLENQSCISRDFLFYIYNSTDFELNLDKEFVKTGECPKSAPEKIDSFSNVSFVSSEKWALKGKLKYYLLDKAQDAAFEITWSNPFVGSNGIQKNCSEGYNIERSGLEGFHAVVRFMFSKKNNVTSPPIQK